MTADSIDTPTPEFRAHLEWEIARTVRREARFGTARHKTRRRRLRAAGLVAVCLALSTVSSFASAQVRDGSRRDSLLDAARADLAIVAIRRDLAQAQRDEASRQARAGVVSAKEVAAADLEVRSLQERIARLRLDMAEIQVASQPPRNDLSAPLVGGRDFVRERLQLELAEAQQRLTAAERAQSDVERLKRAGVATELETGAGQVELARTRAGLAVLAEQDALRREFVEKGTPADQLARRLDAAQLREDSRVATQSLELARLRADLVRRQRAAGAVTELEALRVLVELQERQLELSRLTTQLQRLEPISRRPGGG